MYVKRNKKKRDVRQANRQRPLCFVPRNDLVPKWSGSQIRKSVYAYSSRACIIKVTIMITVHARVVAPAEFTRVINASSSIFDDATMRRPLLAKFTPDNRLSDLMRVAKDLFESRKYIRKKFSFILSFPLACCLAKMRERKLVCCFPAARVSIKRSNIDLNDLAGAAIIGSRLINHPEKVEWNGNFFLRYF